MAARAKSNVDPFTPPPNMTADEAEQFRGMVAAWEKVDKEAQHVHADRLIALLLKRWAQASPDTCDFVDEYCRSAAEDFWYA